MTLRYMLFGSVIAVYLMVSMGAIKAIRETIVLSARQKRINYVLVWLIPFLWALSIRGAIKKTPGSHEAPPEIEPRKSTFTEGDMGE